jgi:hypothetical protein
MTRVYALLAAKMKKVDELLEYIEERLDELNEEKEELKEFQVRILGQLAKERRTCS